MKFKHSIRWFIKKRQLQSNSSFLILLSKWKTTCWRKFIIIPILISGQYGQWGCMSWKIKLNVGNISWLCFISSHFDAAISHSKLTPRKLARAVEKLMNRNLKIMNFYLFPLPIYLFDLCFWSSERKCCDGFGYNFRHQYLVINIKVRVLEKNQMIYHHHKVNDFFSILSNFFNFCSGYVTILDCH